MITDGRELNGGSTLSCEICVVGAGVAGLTIAREFFNTGKEVIILESGGLKPKLSSNDLTSGDNVGIPYYNLEDTQARAFGGTSHLWHVDIKREIQGVRLRGMDSIDFEEKEWVPYSGWPITKQELDPYYKRAHELFKLGPYSYEFKDWIEPDEFNYLDTEAGDVYTTVFQFARKDIFYNDYYPEFEKSENIKVFLNSTVLSIETTENTRSVTHLSVSTPEGEKFNVEARNYILATGGLGNPRLLLLSDRYSKKGLGNQNDLVGRFFMEHPHIWGHNAVGTFYPKDSNRFNKNNIFNLHYRKETPVMGYLALREEVIRQNRLLNFTIGIRGKSKKYPKGSLEALLALRKFLWRLKHFKSDRQLVKQLKTFSGKTNVVIYECFRRLLNGNIEEWSRYGLEDSGIDINLMAEQIPNPESRVQLGAKLDKFDQKKLVLDWELSDSSLESMKKSMDIINTNLRKKNLGYIDIRLKSNKLPKELKGGYHHMGTTRMHENPSRGVVDENCKLHGTDNLFIAGSSVFPTSGYANPTLTISALSIRLADYLQKMN